MHKILCNSNTCISLFVGDHSKAATDVSAAGQMEQEQMFSHTKIQPIFLVNEDVVGMYTNTICKALFFIVFLKATKK